MNPKKINQTRFTSGERAIARSLVKTDGIKVALNARIILRVKARGTGSKVKITSKLKGINQGRKDRIQENTIAVLQRNREAEIRFLTDEWYDMSSRNKKKNGGELKNYLALKTTY